MICGREDWPRSRGKDGRQRDGRYADKDQRASRIYILRKTTPGVIFIVALLATLASYAQTLRFGFRYDDYHVLRPTTAAELVQVLHGSWDPTQIESAFYRPLTAWWYALRFELFGLNAVAQHALSLAGMIACATLVGLFVWRETESRRAALFAAALYAVHPSLAYSQAVWLTNQMHLLASLVVLLALLAWQRARTRPPSAWWPIAVLQLVGFGIKEDLVMLAPLLLMLTAVRRLMRRDVPWPAWPVIAIGLAFPVGLFALRYEMLGRLGGYGPTPSADHAWTNFSTGLVRVFRQLPAKRPWEPFVSAFSQAVVASGVVLGFVRRREVHLLVSGIVLAVAFDAPFVFVSKAEQYHLIALGAVLALTGAIEVLIALVPPRVPQLAVTSALAVALLPFVPLTRNIAEDFAPCSAITLRTDDIVVDWWVVPPEIQDWLRGKAAACRAGTLVPLPRALRSATWAYGVEVDEHGRRFQWTSEHAVVMLSARTTAVQLDVRRPNASNQAPTTVRLQSGGSTVTLTLTSPEWQTATVPLGGTFVSWLTKMHRVDIASSPVFIPAEVDATNPDRRHLGVQIRAAHSISTCLCGDSGHGSGMAATKNVAPSSATFFKKFPKSAARSAGVMSFQNACMIGVTPIRKMASSSAPSFGASPVRMLTPPATSSRPVPITASSGAGTPCAAVITAIAL